MRRRARRVELHESNSVAKVFQELEARGMTIDHYSASDQPLFELIEGEGERTTVTPLFSIPRILEALKTTGCEMIIGSRFVAANGWSSSFMRSLGIRFFRAVLRPILGKQVHDPTSGFVGVNRRALQVFSRTFPLEYPEIETLVVLQRRRFRFEEVPCKMYRRKAGRSSITAMKSFYYITHVLLGVFMNVLKYERRRRRETDAGAGG